MNEPLQNTVRDLGRPGPPPADPADLPPLPQRIGRYRVERLLGKGGFGFVYLAHDEQLERLVAIKVPHAKLVAQITDAEAYLVEARAVARLDHPNIAPVFDVGSSDDFPCFIVSKFIDGTSLFQRLRQGRLSLHQVVQLVATVAEAVHHAHRNGLVHRDIKPGNILLDQDEKPFVADFGLALREQDVGRETRHAGTPPYMSPEQARGEGHRVDGRSDIFSLGIVFYELLTGRRPFRGDTRKELLDEIVSLEPRPPRQIDDAIPRELERICLVALSKRASERYTTAKDMAADLWHFVNEHGADALPSTGNMPVLPSGYPATSGASSMAPTLATSDSRPLNIVPKGLRSFDKHDADFFLELLPGPRGRDGLPESIRFWKTRIEENDAERTFPVGLIYGPSGCGKSSLVKAGLLPSLSPNVLAIYIEAAAEGSEARLLRSLQKCCPNLPATLGLKEVLTSLRRGEGLPPGKKVLLVLDQFEQWLHSRKEGADHELIEALRQCDGARVQCVVMVRDDFWLAVSRFMRDLEIRLVEGQNSVLTDLFDEDHARKVLAAFGRAFGRLPESAAATDKEQRKFLKQAVAGLAREGKVISVRLALFAEMMKDQPWTPGSLRAMGGTEGVGVAFLEETFSTNTAPPQHRYHQKGARAVLKSLLPEAGTDIKGQMQSQQQLLEVSGYANRPVEFDELIRILDGEIRLITPTEQEGKDEAGRPAIEGGGKYYQLTHDYLVPALREWLTRKQKETRRGRAELLLADYAAVWNSRPDNRQLPSLLESLQIHWLTARRNWTAPQQKMMARGRRYHAGRGLVVAVILAVLGWGGYEAHGRFQASALHDRLLDAQTSEVPTIVPQMLPYRRWLDGLLYEALTRAEAANDSRKRLHASLALLPVDTTQIEYLSDRLLDVEPIEVPVVRDALAPHKARLCDKLWDVVGSPEREKGKQRLQAASALACYDAPESADESGPWQRASRIITEDFLAAVQKNPSHFAALLEQLRPVRLSLLPALTETYRNRERPEPERSFAANILADYASDNPRLLADLLMDADATQFPLIYPKLKEYGTTGLNILQDELGKRRDPALDGKEKARLAGRQANAALAIWRQEGPSAVRYLLESSHDPTLRSYLVRRLGPFGTADAREIMRLAVDESNIPIRRALIVSLGDFRDTPSADRAEIVERLLGIYEHEADAGLHAAAAFVLEAWGENARIEAALTRLRLSEKEIRARHAARPAGPPVWHVNGQKQTMIVIRGPVQFVMGSPPGEARREESEVQHTVRIARTFAIADRPVTVDDFRRLNSARPTGAALTFPPPCPVTQVTWYDAAVYCNRLSREMGIPTDQWCYEVDANDDVMKMKDGFLNLIGYRLPTEAEMEFATRADTLSTRYFGEPDELAAGYGWYVPNCDGSIQPVGRLRPNDYGFFDMYGNVWNWCQEKNRGYPLAAPGQVFEDELSDLDAGPGPRVLRGGCYTDHAWGLRSAHRWQREPAHGSNIIGFRVARTMPAR